MKNVHVLPTEKPSRLIIYSTLLNEFRLLDEPYDDWKHKRNIYITSDEFPKAGDWHFNLALNLVEKTTSFHNGLLCEKIILTTDQDLIKDGVQAIDDKFLEWFVKNPSCEFVEVDEEKHFEVDKSKRANPLNGFYYSHKLIIPQEEPKTGYVKSKTEFLGVEFTLKDGSKQFVPIQETLEEAAEKYCLINNIPTDQMIVKNDRSCEFETPVTMFLKGANYQAERMYSEEDIEKAHFAGKIGRESFNIWFEQFKKK
jgi:hypothetical protein